MDNYFSKHFETFTNIFADIAGGGFFCMQMDEYFTLLSASEGFYTIHEYTPESIKTQFNNQCVRFVHPDDVGRVLHDWLCAASEKRERLDWHMRIVTGNGKLKYIHCIGILDTKPAQPIIHGVVVDETAQQMLLEENRIDKNTLQVAIEQTNIAFGTFDLKNKRIIQDPNSRQIFGSSPVVENVPDCVLGTGILHPDDEKAFVKFYDDLLAGAPKVVCACRVMNEQTGNYCWTKIIFNTIYDENGRPVKAIGSALDISEQMELQQKYESQMSYKNIVEENMLGSFRLNLTKNRCEEGKCEFPFISKLKDDGTTDGFLKKAYEAVPDFEQRQAYKAIFNRASLISGFMNGENHHRLEHRLCVCEKHCEWVETQINVTKNPFTGDIEALIYAVNINKEKLLQQLIEHTVERDYDYLVLLDANDESHLDIFNDKTEAVHPQIQLEKYSSILEQLVEAENLPEDRERLRQEKKLSTVIAKLNETDPYILSYDVRHQDGSIHRKKLRYSYLDKDAGLIAISSTDITSATKTEMKKNELLNTALVAAKQANAAKTDFLSRMSHEIRTPMNAIIGMTAIAAQTIGDDEQTADCIAKIGISSRFLLSLINDILDMSRIESGKVLLKTERIQFTELIASINAICYEQARSKNIEYECVVDNDVEDSYMGDPMKLQQILINILSNAIKFTDSGGKVSIDIKQLKKTNKNATLRFVVHDTGCGIREEFIPRLFEPFAQEHTGSTTMYGGTGLGLPISKNLTELMDGRIDVRSIEGLGSEFSVTVKLGLTAQSKFSSVQTALQSFTKLSTLVVDDDPTVCRYALLTLKDIGMQAEWVDSGEQAIMRVRDKQAKKEYFDFIIIDWKMPGLDGIETAKEIRRMVGPEVTIIIMTAYDWPVIEHEARLAGVNQLVSKPLFKSTLISAFNQALHEKELGAEREEPVVYDFTGHRVLLVEDHPLNVEVAKKLLECRGFLVEHAENGLRAIEMVTLAKEHYYDAILMDIRMPVMDGLQAAAAIRKLKKKSAGSIPIIAMTANAFDDDIEKSKRAGMNAHLAKPIDPEKLYETLYYYIAGKDKEASQL